MTNPADAHIRRKVNFRVLGVGGVLLLALAAGVFMSWRFVEDERLRTLQAWQIRLGIVADSRVAAVNEWVDEQFSVLRELSENASLQLYMTELAMAEGDREAIVDQAAQAGYLRNLLVAMADRSGFTPPSVQGEVAANVERVGVAGIGLLDATGRPIVSSAGMPPADGRIRAAVNVALGGEPAVVDLYMGASNLPTMGFALPVYGVQDDGVRAIGAVVGVRVVGRDLFRRLQQPGETEKTAETYLIRAADGVIEYLSPLADGTPPLGRSLARDTPGLADAFAIDNPGGFAIRRDYGGKEALITSRPLAALPWSLVRKVSRAEALSESETRLHTILTVLVLTITGVGVTVIAVWRHGSSVRAAKAAEQYRVAAERFENLIQFMRTVTDSQPTHIVCLTPEDKITFANRPFAAHYGVPITDIRFKPMSAVVGPVVAKALFDVNKKVIEDGTNQHRIHRFGEGDDLRVLSTDHVHIPADATHPPAALTVIHDVTELERERDRNERMMRQLVDTLVGVVDRRDPWAAHHSSRVAEVARAIAIEMGLPEEEARTVDIAGSLMNLGKIVVPSEVLTKTGNLTPEEREMLACSHLTGAELLENVPFQGPVVETIRQMGESWDGSGPLGLMAEDILRTARILSVANAFVGMISARAWREALPFDKVANILLGDSGARFDRKPVSALINFLENRGGTETWAHFRARPEISPPPATPPEPPAPQPPQDSSIAGKIKVSIANPGGRPSATFSRLGEAEEK